jgi:hypothetical protein
MRHWLCTAWKDSSRMSGFGRGCVKTKTDLAVNQFCEIQSSNLTDLKHAGIVGSFRSIRKGAKGFRSALAAGSRLVRRRGAARLLHSIAYSPSGRAMRAPALARRRRVRRAIPTRLADFERRRSSIRCHFLVAIRYALSAVWLLVVLMRRQRSMRLLYFNRAYLRAFLSALRAA